MTEEESAEKTTTEKKSIYVADQTLSEIQHNAAWDPKKKK
jgi:hypothetical protein